jgi:hypothetical protein
MVTRSTPAIVLGPTGNLQGTYKFFSLATGKKVKQRVFAPYPMPDSVIKKVEAYAKLTALPGIFDFADRNGILFEWNEEVDESPEGIVDVKNVTLYPSLAAEHPGVALGQDQPLPSIEVELVPQGRAKDAAARNANIQPLDIAGVWAAPPLVHANVNELDAYKSDDNNGSIAVADIPQQPPHAPLVINNTNNDNMGRDEDGDDTESNDKESNDEDDAERNDDKLSDLTATTDLDGNEPGKDQGVQRLQHRRKCATKKYANYSLLMAARRARRGGPHRALIREGCVFFSADDLSDAKPIPEEDREEFALGVALIHYSMNAGIKKFETKGEAGVTKELTQMHDMSVCCPIEVESLTYNERKKALSSLMFLKEKRESSIQACVCAGGRKQRDGT